MREARHATQNGPSPVQVPGPIDAEDYFLVLEEPVVV